MALFERRFLTTRVARRLLGLFVLCALLPLSLSSWLSYRHVTRELSNQGEERLRQSAAAAGMSVIERLMAAEAELGALAAADPAPGAPLQTGSARFRLLAGVARGPEGAAPTWGTGQAPAILPVLDEPTRAFLDDGGTHLILDGQLRRPVLVRRDPAGSGLLAASVRTDSLWATAQVYSASEVGRALCVLDPYGEPLVCPHGLPASLRSQATAARSEPVRWGRGADERLGWGWQIFLSGQFRAEPWVAIVSEPARAALAPLNGFTRAFVPTLLLALWSVLLLSNVQIRRTIDPLDRLKAGTERIAEGHFESRVVVTSHDEFGELAAAFNGMAQDLGRQFRTLEALHALDRQALESQSLDPVLERIDDPLRHALPGTELGMVLLDDDEGATLLRGTADADRRRALVRLAPGTLHLIHRWGDHHVLEGDERAPLIAIGAVEGHRTRPVHVFPLRARSEAAGFLWIERTDGQLLNETEQTQARQLADQAALSLASVRRLVDLNGLKEGALDALALAIDASSHWTAGHSQRVTDLSVR
ncbi:MAG: HAMP domain-containing protein, partial [Gemmatimonadetes bacterium]|nr:HAMP domain-containing protein [Gemmatimonadota bacterium]